MPRDANGNFTLPSGNPVVTGTTIESAWANLTMDDIRQGLTDSLDRFGRGGMQAPFRFVDGSASAPGMSWASELSTGFFRAGASNMTATVAGVPRMRWTGTGVDIWNPAGAGSWYAIPVTPLDTSNFALLNAVNTFTAAQQVIQNASGSWAIWKDSTPTLAGRLGFNISAADTLELSYFNGASWRPRYFAGAANVQHYSTQHIFWDEPGNNRFALLTAGGLSVGPTTFAPVAASTTVLGAIANSGRAETGAFLNNGVNSQRASIFVTDIGGIAVGLDWVFSSAVAAFEFRRAGTEIFNYTTGGVAIRNALTLQFWNAANADVCSIGMAGANLNFNTGTANGFQFFPGGAAVARIISTGLETLGGASFTARNTNNALAMTLRHDGTNGTIATGSGAGQIWINPEGQTTLAVGTTGADFYFGKWARFFDVPNGQATSMQQTGTGFNVNNSGTGFSFGLDSTGTLFTIDTNGLSVLAGRSLRIWAASNNFNVAINYLADNGGNAQVQVGGRGAAWHWNPPNHTAGDIVVSSSTPAATGRIGSIVLVFE